LEPAIVLFDGVCNLCNGTVQFVIRRDRARRFRFAPLQSEAAARACAAAGVAIPTRDPGSMLLILGDRVVDRSTAALHIARRLPFPWPLCAIFLLVPKVLRDLVYRVIARYRYRWFGKNESCMVPTPELRERFLAGSERLR
jgi:predicted DCC family thiol-disulfide oxidoreductase YuxK